MAERDKFLPETETNFKPNKKEVTEPIVQIGFKIETDGSIREKDFYLIGFDSKRKPKYKEELDRFDNIWAEYKNKKEEMKGNGDERHIYLIPKGRRIEGVGRYRYLSGWLTSDVLAVRKEKSNNLNLIYSFNEKGKNVFTIAFNGKNGEKRAFGLNSQTDILDYNARIDLDRLKDADDLRTEMNNRLSQKR